MSRRLPKLCAALCFALAGTLCFHAQGGEVPPNILLINADDYRADGIGALGNDLARTPNLDALVTRGFVFRHAYTMGSFVGAVCLPSRTQLLTGRSLIRAAPIQAAGTQNAPKVFDPALTMPKALARAGYETFHVGKQGNEFRAALEAFDRSIIRDDRNDQRPLSSRRHADTVIEFLRGRKGNRPFFIYLAPPVPHDPRVAEPEFHKLFDPQQIPLPKSFQPQHPFDNGEMMVRDERLLPWPRTPEAIRKELADYYACIAGLDHHLGRIFDCLRGLKQLDRTIIVFCGDNGLSLGEHGLLGKQNLYEFGGMHVPLVLAGPRVPKGESKAFVYHMDLLPTFCEIAGSAVPEGVDGKSLWPVIQGCAPGVRDFCFTAYRQCQRAVRDDRWKMIRYPLINKSQLFDLVADPREMNDLAGNPVLADKLAGMTDLLQRAQKQYGDTAPFSVASPSPAAWSPPATERPASKPAPAPAQ